MSFVCEMYEDMPCMHRILDVGKNKWELYIYNEPLMIIIALVLALVEKTMTWNSVQVHYAKKS